MTEKGAIFVGDRFLRVWLSLLTVLCVVTFIAVLGVSPSDGGVLLLYDANGTLRAAIGLTTENNAAIDLNDAAGNRRVAIQVNANGTVTAKGLR
jgi:hypothetical protein